MPGAFGGVRGGGRHRPVADGRRLHGDRSGWSPEQVGRRQVGRFSWTGRGRPRLVRPSRSGRSRLRIGSVREPAEEPLSGGNLSSGVVRGGEPVPGPPGRWTPAVHALLRHLETKCFTGAPRV